MQSVSGCGDKMSTKRSAPESSDEEPEVPENHSQHQSSGGESNNGSDDARNFSKNEGSQSDEPLGDANEEEFKEDPLLMDVVPESLDPEQLGFLLCAQETLCFLRATGSQGQELYVNLHGRFMEVMEELGIA